MTERTPHPAFRSIAVPESTIIAKSRGEAGDLAWVTLDRASWGPATGATHVRDEDLVFGVTLGDQAYALPLFVVDYYHTVNTEISGEPVVLVSCDRCASAGAWHATLPDGRHLLFRNWGILAGQLIWRDTETRSLWLHSEAIAFDGELAGSGLDPLGVVVVCEWRDWHDWHPDTLVLDEVRHDVSHKDMRHGHGREEFFERRGIGIHEREHFFSSQGRAWDERRPEQEMVLGVSEPEGTRTYPWRELKHEGNVVNDAIGSLPVAVLCDPGPDRFAIAAFDRRIDGRVLELAARDAADVTVPGVFFTDLTTGSVWDLEGRCRGGPLAGRRLRPLRSVFKRWFSWSLSHPEVGIFESPRRIAGASTWPDAGELGPVLDAMRHHARSVTLDDELPVASLPAGVVRGVQVWLDDHRFWLLVTADTARARDLAELPHEWQDPQRAIAFGRHVLKDEVEARWEDWAHTRRKHDDDVAWSALLSDPGFVAGVAAACDAIDPGPHPARRSLSDVLDRLVKGGWPVDMRFTRVLPRSSCPPGCEAALETRFAGGDRCILYSHVDDAEATAAAKHHGHSVASGRFVLRSTPLDMYRVRASEVMLRGDARTSWSPLLDDSGFLEALREATDETS